MFVLPFSGTPGASRCRRPWGQETILKTWLPSENPVVFRWLLCHCFSQVAFCGPHNCPPHQLSQPVLQTPGYMRTALGPPWGWGDSTAQHPLSALHFLCFRRGIHEDLLPRSHLAPEAVRSDSSPLLLISCQNYLSLV